MALGFAGNGSLKPTDQRSDQITVPVVYFDLVEIPGTDLPPRIHVGESGNHVKRQKQHAKSKLGVEFAIKRLCVVRGTPADEKAVHRYFKKYLLPGEEETFCIADELVDYIRWLRDQYFVWVPDCDQCVNTDISQMDCVDAAAWTPLPERRKPAPLQAGLFSDFGPLRLPPREVTVDDFYTNAMIIDAARRTLGSIELDPASHAVANYVVKAMRFFTVHDNGLTKEWRGKVWLNPPFSNWQEWVPKILEEWQSGRVEAMCVLCATRTLTAQYFSGMHERCTGMCILRGRIPFWGGRAGDSPDDGHAVFYFGNDAARFTRAFKDIGNVYWNNRLSCVAAGDAA